MPQVSRRTDVSAREKTTRRTPRPASRHLRLSCSRLNTNSTTTPRAPSESPSEPLDSRSSCDGWRPKPRHDGRPQVPAHRLRVYQSGRADCSRASPSRCVLSSVTHMCVGRLCRARQRVLQGRLFTCLPRAVLHCRMQLRGPIHSLAASAVVTPACLA